MENNKDTLNELVSIIMPSYNSAGFIGETIDSVRNQTYTNWELIIVDDCSKDHTLEVLKGYVEIDNRIQYFKLDQNSGAAVARNYAIEKAKGAFLAFLDSDDLWKEHKLENQLNFMKKNQYDFTCTEYEERNDEENTTRVVGVQDSLDYDGVLKYCPGNSTVMYNVKKLGKFYAPDVKKRNDFALWLKVIKKAGLVHGLHEANTVYRVRLESLSSNKTDLIKHQWHVYRNIEKLSLTKSVYLLVHKIISVIFKNKRMGVSKND